MAVLIERSGAIAVLLCALGVACSKSDGPRPASPGELPNAVSIEARTIKIGLPTGIARKDVSVASFRITATPVTTTQYQQCVDAKACSVAETCTAETVPAVATRDPASPATCLRVQQAQDYCQWAGGRLPTVAEWTLATRDGALATYTWGEAPATCAQHPRATADCCGTSCSDPTVFSVSKHSANAASNGVGDVLLTSGELIGAWDEPFFGACQAPHPACIAYGRSPAAFDGLMAAGADVPLADTSFRCVWEVAQ